MDALATLIAKYQSQITDYVLQVFRQDPVLQGLITSPQIEQIILETTAKLTAVIHRVWKRLQWAIAEMDRLERLRQKVP